MIRTLAGRIATREQLERFSLSVADLGPGPGAWVNSLFRNEGAGLSSELIRQAVAATRATFGEPPALGLLTFVNAAKVRPKRDPGWCYLRAGFRRVGTTKGGLVALQMLPCDMPAAQEPLGALSLFGAA